MEPMTQAQLIEILDDIRARVEVGDSWEGYLNYLLPEPDDAPEVRYRVEARYRIGNLDGQGSMRMVGVDIG